MRIVNGRELQIGDKVLVPNTSYDKHHKLLCNFSLREVTSDNVMSIQSAFSLVLEDRKNIKDSFLFDKNYIVFDEGDSCTFLNGLELKQKDRKQSCYDIRGKSLQVGFFIILFDKDKIGDTTDAQYGLALGKYAFTENGNSLAKRVLYVENPTEYQLSLYNKLVREYKRLEQSQFLSGLIQDNPGVICVATNNVTKYFYLGYRKVIICNEEKLRHVYIKLNVSKEIGKYLYEWLITGCLREDKMNSHERDVYRLYGISSKYMDYNILDILNIFVTLDGRKKDNTYKALVTTVEKKTFLRYINIKTDINDIFSDIVLDGGVIIKGV